MTIRTKLMVLLVVQVALTIMHIFLRNEAQPWSWHFALGMCFGIFVLVYAFSIQCPVPTCRARQVFRGWSAFDVRLPQEHCYRCGTALT
jgi:hypothetical protein